MNAEVNTPTERYIVSEPSPLRSITVIKATSLFVLMALSAWFVLQNAGQNQAILLLLGYALGAVLFYATFSFSNGWRRMVSERKSLWLRAQMVMLVVASALILPVLAEGSLWGSPVFAYIRPIGASLIVGAFIFGIGMQLVGSCASGTLYNSGGGQLKMLIALITFATGALLASAHYGWWMNQANFLPVDLTSLVGVWGAVSVNTLIAGGFYWLFRTIEKQRYGKVAPLWNTGTGRVLLLGGLALAGLNFITVGVAGRPWSVANAFPLWGAKGSEWLGVELDLDFWDYWVQPAAESALSGGLLDDATSVMNIGIIAGALVVATLTTRFKLKWRLTFAELMATAFGGLLLGYGATIGFGCNVGAFIGGVVSGSLHGWIWFLAAFAGTAIVVVTKGLRGATPA
ncbi:MAG: YeeE/YedE family protein [Cycloclasticus sp.]